MSTLLDRSRLMSLDEESIFVERAVRGDQSAFMSLYQRYYGKVYSIAKGILLTADEAEDAAQEVFTLAYRNLHRFDKRARFSTWLFRIAVNRSIQESRKRRFSKADLSLSEELEATSEGASTEQPDPRVTEALSQIPPADRAVLTLFYWDELSLQEVGDSLGCSANAAKTRLFRARERFREAFEETGE